MCVYFVCCVGVGVLGGWGWGEGHGVCVDVCVLRSDSPSLPPSELVSIEEDNLAVAREAGFEYVETLHMCKPEGRPVAPMHPAAKHNVQHKRSPEKIFVLRKPFFNAAAAAAAASE